MEDIKQSWAHAKDLIRPKITAMSFHKWIDPLDPVIVQNSIFVLQAPDDTTKRTLTDFYYDYLRSAVLSAFPDVLDVLLIVPNQRADFVRIAEDTNVNAFSLNPKYTFDTFVVGGSNSLAHAAAVAVSNKPGMVYNPLFLYGGVGLGKTHLMHAIGHAVQAEKIGAKVMYVTSEAFTNELIEALRAGKNIEFRQRYRNVDVLMIDDIQFLSGRQQTQEEFFNTFNTLYNAGKQIVISSDRPPKEISALEERLRSRFEQGLIADIQPPDIETRIAILRNRAQIEKVDVDDQVIQFIAENVKSNIRQLEGSLNRVIAYSALKKRSPDITLAREALKEIMPETKRAELTPERIKETVSSYFGVTQESMLSQRRDREIVVPRQLTMYFMHSLLSLPYKRIAAQFGRDHTTVMNACDRIAAMIDEDPAFKKKVEDVTGYLME